MEGLSGQVSSTKEKTNKISFLLCMIIMVAVVAVGSVIAGLVIWNHQNSQSSDTSEEATTALDNSNLSSGSVVATIDGKEVTYKAAYIVDGIEATIVSGEYESIADDEAVFLVINGGKLTVRGDDITIKKAGTQDGGRGDDYSFYGINSAVVVVGNDSLAILDGVKIITEAGGANAVVATKSGHVEMSNSEIKTTADGSRGLHATYDGTIEASTVVINTEGQSSASLATDRGEGTIKAENMELSTAGAGSPLIYSTGDITVGASTGVASGAQIAVVEGSNSITLTDCDFSTNGNGNRNNIDNAGVMIYQSMSGDAAEGKGKFTANASTLSILQSSDIYNTTPMFFVTNTAANIVLNDTTLNYSPTAYFVSAKGTTEWGRAGSNGGKVTVELGGTSTAGPVQTDYLSTYTSNELN